MTMTGHPLKRLNMKSEYERRNKERILTSHPDPAVRAAAVELVAANAVPDETYDSTYGRAIHVSGNTSPQARRRDARALAGSSEGWTQQAVHLSRAYNHALGWALTYGIEVFTVTERGVYMRGLYELCEDIRTAEAHVIEAKRMVECEAFMSAELNHMLTELDTM